MTGPLLLAEVAEFPAFFSMSRASLYNITPKITVNVPKPLRNVTGLWKINTDNQINNARLTVLATLEENHVSKHKILDSDTLPMCDGWDIGHDRIGSDRLNMIWNPVEDV